MRSEQVHGVRVESDRMRQELSVLHDREDGPGAESDGRGNPWTSIFCPKGSQGAWDGELCALSNIRCLRRWLRHIITLAASRLYTSISAECTANLTLYTKVYALNK